MDRNQQSQPPCQCAAYPFPHRAGSGECGKLDYCPHGIARARETCYQCQPPRWGWTRDAGTGEWVPRGRPCSY
jgi:hypothetical protein